MYFDEVMIVKYFIIFAFLGRNLVWAGTRINFLRCGYSGITCVQNGTRIVEVKYQCPKDVDDVVIYINQFSLNTFVEKLEISNCGTLTLSTRCFGESNGLQQLLVTNIKHLIFKRLQYEPMLPRSVILKNISYIQTIPFRTFAQIEKPYYSYGCYVHPVDFQTLHFENVSVDVVESNAFVGLNDFKNFTFINVKIKTLQTYGIRLKMNHTGVFEVRNSHINEVEYSAIQIYSKRALIVENQFTNIWSSGINGTVEDFFFNHNIVETLHPYSFSLLATNVFMVNNNFLYLKSGALEKVSPGLIQDSGRNFAKLKFVYDFSKNFLNFVDSGSLNPDYVSYENVPTEMMFSRNSFLCSCENLGWMFSRLGHGPNTAQLESFYEMILDDSYENNCDKSYKYKQCNLTLRSIQKIIKNDKCPSDVDITSLCDDKNGVSSTSEKVIITKYSQEPHEFTNSPILGSVFYSISSAAGFSLNIALRLLVLLLFRML